MSGFLGREQLFQLQRLNKKQTDKRVVIRKSRTARIEWEKFNYLMYDALNLLNLMCISVLQRIIRYSNIRIIEDRIMIFVFVFGPF